MRVAASLLLTAVLVSPASFLAQTPPPAPANPIAALSFLSGRWTSDSPEDQEEEYWSPVMGESIIGHFRVVQKNKPGEEKAIFYELWTIELEDSKPIFKMKHYNHGLIGWEEKADVIRLETKIEGPHTVLFTRPDGTLSIRYERKGDELISTLHQIKNGAPHEELFRLHLSQ